MFLISSLHCFFANITPCPLVLLSSLTVKKIFLSIFSYPFNILNTLNGYENIDRIFFFTVKEERRTRGHGVTLAKKQCRLDIRKYKPSSGNYAYFFFSGNLIVWNPFGYKRSYNKFSTQQFRL